jgi:hypothetical protein
MCKETLQKLNSSEWFLHHNNAPSHPTLAVCTFLAKIQDGDTHSPYSSNLAPSDCFLFPKMKTKLEGQHFNSTEEIQQETLAVLSDIPQLEFQCCFETRKKRKTGCINCGGDCFEEDHAYFVFYLLYCLSVNSQNFSITFRTIQNNISPLYTQYENALVTME